MKSSALGALGVLGVGRGGVVRKSIGDNDNTPNGKGLNDSVWFCPSTNVSSDA